MRTLLALLCLIPLMATAPVFADDDEAAEPGAAVRLAEATSGAGPIGCASSTRADWTRGPGIHGSR